LAADEQRLKNHKASKMATNVEPKRGRRRKAVSGETQTDPPLRIARELSTGALVNLSGNYDYLSDGYYISQEYEHAGDEIRPDGKEMLDAYIPPLCLEKARQAGIPIPEYYISNGYFDPPVIADPVNPFTLRGKVVLKAGKAKSIGKSLTRNYTYAICCQELPEGARLIYFQSVLGWSVNASYRDISQKIWDVFSIPLARVRIIQTSDGDYLLSDISPLFVEDLKAKTRKYLEERISWER
jgi:hypothetical protein